MRSRSNTRRPRLQHAANGDVAAVMNAIRALVGALNQSARAIERETGVTNAQLFVLRELAECEPLSINDIAARAMTLQSTASLLVARLVSLRLVRRTADVNDARRALISLTARGRRIADRASEPPTAQVLRALGELRPGTRRGLGDALTQLLDSMGLSRTDSPPLFERSSKRPTKGLNGGRPRRRSLARR